MVDDLIERAMLDRDRPLYVLALGTPTNVSSAILKEPAITSRIVVIPLGGRPYEFPGFNRPSSILVTEAFLIEDGKIIEMWRYVPAMSQKK